MKENAGVAAGVEDESDNQLPENSNTRLQPPPAFLIYAPNLRTQRHHQEKDLAEFGLWLLMHVECWINGVVPADTRLLARVLGQDPDQVDKALTARVLRDFEERGAQGTPDHVLICPALIEYRRRLDKRHAAQSSAGGETQRKLREKRERERLARKLAGSLPDGQAGSSLIQTNPTQTLEGADISTEHKEWVQEFASGEPDFARGRERTKPGIRG